MSSISQEILERFFAQLADSEHLNEEHIEELQALFAAKRKPKAAEIIEVLASEETDELS